MTNEQKEWIDTATYRTLLHKWRFAAIGDKMFRGDVGNYFSNVMAEKKKHVDPVRASKDVGWKS